MVLAQLDLDVPYNRVRLTKTLVVWLARPIGKLSPPNVFLHITKSNQLFCFHQFKKMRRIRKIHLAFPYEWNEYICRRVPRTFHTTSTTFGLQNEQPVQFHCLEKKTKKLPLKSSNFRNLHDLHLSISACNAGFLKLMCLL